MQTKFLQQTCQNTEDDRLDQANSDVAETKANSKIVYGNESIDVNNKNRQRKSHKQLENEMKRSQCCSSANNFKIEVRKYC